MLPKLFLRLTPDIYAKCTQTPIKIKINNN